MRRLWYWLGLAPVQKVDAQVIVIGNAVAGGAGKTPAVIAVVQYLRARQHMVGVISRGYGRGSSECLEVLDDSRPQSVGDEPLLIRQATRAPVFVAGTRYAAACALLARYPQTRVIVCDDGLQHYGLYRDVEVCVFDDRGCGNGWLLPAGPLREPWPRKALAKAGQADAQLLVLHTGLHPAFAGFRANRSLQLFARSMDDTRVALESLYHPGAKPLVALAGIAHPESFFSMLRAMQVPLLKTVALPDHYDFRNFPTTEYANMRLLCTEKDAAKLWQVVPDALAVPLQFEPEAAFFAALDHAMSAETLAKLS
jgi:tetraacyldisaccharide 4'-kinase